MKMMLIIYSGGDARLVPELLDRHHVSGWTELAGAHGAGTTGRYAGTRAWPGESTVWFTAVPADRADALTVALGEAARGLPPGDRLHAAVLPVETFF